MRLVTVGKEVVPFQAVRNHPGFAGAKSVGTFSIQAQEDKDMWRNYSASTRKAVTWSAATAVVVILLAVIAVLAITRPNGTTSVVTAVAPPPSVAQQEQTALDKKFPVPAGAYDGHLALSGAQMRAFGCTPVAQVILPKVNQRATRWHCSPAANARLQDFLAGGGEWVGTSTPSPTHSNSIGFYE